MQSASCANASEPLMDPDPKAAGAGERDTVEYDRLFNQLCHLIALNRTDKVDGAVESLVMTTLVVDPATNHRSASTIDAAVFVLYGARVSEDALERALDH